MNALATDDALAAAEEVVGSDDPLGLAIFDALGWSMGGAIVQRRALERPGAMRRRAPLEGAHTPARGAAGSE